MATSAINFASSAQNVAATAFFGQSATTVTMGATSAVGRTVLGDKAYEKQMERMTGPQDRIAAANANTESLVKKYSTQVIADSTGLPPEVVGNFVTDLVGSQKAANARAAANSNPFANIGSQVAGAVGGIIKTAIVATGVPERDIQRALNDGNRMTYANVNDRNLITQANAYANQSLGMKSGELSYTSATPTLKNKEGLVDELGQRIVVEELVKSTGMDKDLVDAVFRKEYGAIKQKKADKAAQSEAIRSTAVTVATTALTLGAAGALGTTLKGFMTGLGTALGATANAANVGAAALSGVVQMVDGSRNGTDGILAGAANGVLGMLVAGGKLDLNGKAAELLGKGALGLGVSYDKQAGWGGMIGVGGAKGNVSVSFSQRGDTTISGSMQTGVKGLQVTGSTTTNGATTVGANYNPSDKGPRQGWNLGANYDINGGGLSGSIGYTDPDSKLGVTSTIDRNGLSTSTQYAGINITTNGPDGFRLDDINWAEQNINLAQDRTDTIAENEILKANGVEDPDSLPKGERDKLLNDINKKNEDQQLKDKGYDPNKLDDVQREAILDKLNGVVTLGDVAMGALGTLGGGLMTGLALFGYGSGVNGRRRLDEYIVDGASYVGGKLVDFADYMLPGVEVNLSALTSKIPFIGSNSIFDIGAQANGTKPAGGSGELLKITTPGFIDKLSRLFSSNGEDVKVRSKDALISNENTEIKQKVIESEKIISDLKKQLALANDVSIKNELQVKIKDAETVLRQAKIAALDPVILVKDVITDKKMGVVESSNLISQTEELKKIGKTIKDELIAQRDAIKDIDPKYASDPVLLERYKKIQVEIAAIDKAVRLKEVEIRRNEVKTPLSKEQQYLDFKEGKTILKSYVQSETELAEHNKLKAKLQGNILSEEIIRNLNSEKTANPEYKAYANLIESRDKFQSDFIKKNDSNVIYDSSGKPDFSKVNKDVYQNYLQTFNSLQSQIDNLSKTDKIRSIEAEFAIKIKVEKYKALGFNITYDSKDSNLKYKLEQLDRAFTIPNNSQYDRIIALNNLAEKGVTNQISLYNISKSSVEGRVTIPGSAQGYLTILNVDGIEVRRPAPLESPDNLTSQQYDKRFNPVKKIVSDHDGTDYSMSIGKPLGSMMEGRVSKIVGTDRDFLHSSDGGNDSYGAHIQVESNGEPKVRVTYAHLSMINVIEGQPVHMGDLVGKSGNSGNSGGPHVHVIVEKKINGRWVRQDNEKFDWKGIP
ncbi:peptidoglycan DD-metalloendopeptidase family protein [Leptospira idonii]|uniref:M23ase beta-sheet core domain-containing protein n=1 Tax=Leptospira idonii TaxID=1193500 RepID=A0A4R9LXA4_9LEPT|nr:peptidoglycan DD-metalloendopeptidase family protein [Leptospira idonii]TGN16871.1 hypothetical protein EHS15_18985 [Leptospira idonii]